MHRGTEAKAEGQKGRGSEGQKVGRSEDRKVGRSEGRKVGGSEGRQKQSKTYINCRGLKTRVYQI